MNPSIIRPLSNDILLSVLFMGIFILSKIKSFSAYYALSAKFSDLGFFAK